MVKNLKLLTPMRSKWWRTVQADLTYIACLWKQFLEQVKFGTSFMRKLGMQTKRCSDTGTL